MRADPIVDRALLDRMPVLRVIARTGVGVDRVDLDEATRRGIPVVITPGSGTNAVAEGTLAMVLQTRPWQYATGFGVLSGDS